MLSLRKGLGQVIEACIPWLTPISDNAIKSLQSAAASYEESGRLTKVAKVCENTAECASKAGDFSFAAQMLLKASDCYQKENDK